MQALGIHLGYTSELGDTLDIAAENVADVHPPGERVQVLFPYREYFNVFH